MQGAKVLSHKLFQTYTHKKQQPPKENRDKNMGYLTHKFQELICHQNNEQPFNCPLNDFGSAFVKILNCCNQSKNRSEAMSTSRAALDRLLDPENTSVTLHTLERAASVIGKRLRIELADV
jgi:hypothetical protein